MEDRPSKISRKEIMVRVACVVVAFGLWLYRYNIQNPETTVYAVPTTIKNEDTIGNNLMLDPNKDITVNNVRFKLTNPNVNVQSYHFLAEIDLQGQDLKIGRNNRVEYTIVTKPDYAIMSESEMKGTTTIDIVEKSVVEKEITVITRGEPAEGYMYLGPSYTDGSESTVTIAGPKESVDKIDKVGFTVDVNGQENKMYITSQALTAFTADGQIYQGNDITISPQRISAVIEISKTKTVPIRISEKGTLSDNVEVDFKTIDITEVEVAGSDKTLEAATEILTETIDISKITKSEVIPVKLVVPEGLKVIDKGKVTDNIEVKVNYEISEIDTKNFKLPITTKNLSSSLNSELGVTEISVILQGKTSDLDLLTENDLEAYLDLTNLNEGTHQVPVKLNKPDNVTLVSMSQDRIEVILTKK